MVASAMCIPGEKVSVWTESFRIQVASMRLVKQAVVVVSIEKSTWMESPKQIVSLGRKVILGVSKLRQAMQIKLSARFAGVWITVTDASLGPGMGMIFGICTEMRLVMSRCNQ